MTLNELIDALVAMREKHHGDTSVIYLDKGLTESVVGILPKEDYVLLMPYKCEEEE